VTDAVRVEHLSKKFRLARESNKTLKAAVLRGGRNIDVREFWALRDISFRVPEGSTFGLIGENGSGKSTMLKCMARILVPTEGTATVRGKVSALLELGAGFHQELTGRENIFLNGAILGLSQKELRRRFDEIVSFAGIEPFIDEPVKNYSSGMYVRLGFSVAINVDPDVLLVDEVLSVGDAAFQRKCNEKFADLKQQGKTIVLVSHGLGEVQNICDEVGWFQHGQLKQLGPAGEVVQAYTAGVQVDRQQDGAGARWGSGEGRLTNVELLDDTEAPTSRIRSGHPLIVRVHYEMSEPIVQPVFGLAIHTLEGVQVAGPNTRAGNCVPEKLAGRGFVDFHIDELPLLPHTYDLTVFLFDFHQLHPFDVRQNVRRFDVERGAVEEESGLVSLGGRWRVGDPVSKA
jgi:ABC-type polysaccharide/polyol phosphate transport system ATPase subunit